MSERVTPSPFGGGWGTRAYDDEVIHRQLPGAAPPWISEFPFVEGMFITELYDDKCTRILAGPFPTPEAAKAFLRLTQ